jgi:hypothetical protein
LEPNLPTLEPHLLELLEEVLFKPFNLFNFYFTKPLVSLESNSPSRITGMMPILRIFPRAGTTFVRSTRARIGSSSQNYFLQARSITISSPRFQASEAASNASLRKIKCLPEFDLTGKVILVSGAARGLGLTQAEALLEAGATGMFASIQENLTKC